MSRRFSILFVALACALPAAGAEAAVIAPPMIEITDAPSTAKVGDQFVVRGRLIPPIVDPPAPSPGIPSIVEIEVVETPKAGKGKGRKTDIFVCIDDHEFVDIDIPVRTSGWASGALVIGITSTSFTPDDGPLGVKRELVIPVVKGNGEPK